MNGRKEFVGAVECVWRTEVLHCEINRGSCYIKTYKMNVIGCKGIERMKDCVLKIAVDVHHCEINMVSCYIKHIKGVHLQ